MKLFTAKKKERTPAPVLHLPKNRLCGPAKNNILIGKCSIGLYLSGYALFFGCTYCDFFGNSEDFTGAQKEVFRADVVCLTQINQHIDGGHSLVVHYGTEVWLVAINCCSYNNSRACKLLGYDMAHCPIEPIS